MKILQPYYVVMTPPITLASKRHTQPSKTKKTRSQTFFIFILHTPKYLKEGRQFDVQVKQNFHVPKGLGTKKSTKMENIPNIL